MSHPIDIPDTPDVREQLAKAQHSAYEAFGLSTDGVQPWEDGYRAAKDPRSTFEWWYFDMQFDDGSTIVTTFSNKPHTDPHGPLRPSVLLITRDPQGHSVRKDLTSSAEDFSASVDSCDVRIGPNTVSGDLKTYTLHIEDGDRVIDLTMTRGAPSWRPGAGVSFFDKAQSQFLAWVVPVPYGTVTGTVTDASGTREVTGTGYHDHNWGNHLMSAMLDHWYWGRAHVGDYSLVYVMMTTKGLFGMGSLNIPTLYLAKGNQLLTDDMVPLRLATSGDVPGPGHQSYPTTLKWTWRKDSESLSFTITEPELIEALDMTADEPSWKRALIHTIEHPMYYDFNANITLEVNLAGIKESVTGRTLYEKMMFR